MYRKNAKNNQSATLEVEKPISVKQFAYKRLIWLFLFGFVLALLRLLGYSLLNKGGDGNAKLPFTDPPPFTLKVFESYDWEGKTEISPAMVKGRPLVINFWASWCIPCKEEAPILVKLSQKYGPVMGWSFWE